MAIIKKTFILFFVVILMACMGACSSYIQDYADALENSDYEAAIALYESKVSNNNTEIEEAKGITITFINKTRDDFSIMIIDDVAALNILEKMEDLDFVSDELQDAENYVAEVTSSRISYKKSLVSEEKGDYISAFALLHDVSALDINYEEAQQKISSLTNVYVETVLIEANRLIDDYCFDDAIILLEKALDLTNNSDSIQESYLECKSAQSKYDVLQKTLVKGKEFTINNLNFKFVTCNLTTAIYGNAGYSKADADTVWLDFVFDVENIGTSRERLYYSDLFSKIVVHYDKIYEYTSANAFVVNMKNPIGIEDSIISNLDPLKSITYHLYVRLPVEVQNTALPIDAIIQTINQELYYSYR